jgi:geranylgeranyl transferase type-2 subunit alpha
MHNIRKVKTTEDKQREKLERSKERAKEYIILREEFLKAKQNNEATKDVLKLLTSLLNMAGDCYTYWNYRKKVLMQLEQEEPESKPTLHLNELSWLESLIPSHPKSYWAWFHREWLTQRIEGMNWKREIELCDSALESDQRNFHCWNYRRFVENSFNVPNEQELAFTTKKIEQNFSNYSSWHQRSYILSKIYEDKPDEFNQVIASELEWIQNAFYTSPEDQSAWFYHRWLTHMVKQYNPSNFESIVEEELQKIEELLVEEPNSKWATLTTIFLMHELPNSTERKEEILKRITMLQKLDPLRINYYKSLESNEAL